MANLCNAGSKKYKPVKLLTVNSSTINIKKIGSAKCIVYAYAQNGVAKAIKITVK